MCDSSQSELLCSAGVADRPLKHVESLYHGETVAVYTLEDGKQHASTSLSRTVGPAKANTVSYLTRCGLWLQRVFLPEGYPKSVSADYLEYQIWDTCQAYFSSISGAMATRAVLDGMGVGNPEATALAATITWILKDGTGLVGRILFAWRFSASLDARCKQWRLCADVINDVAMTLEMAGSLLGPVSFQLAVVLAGLAKSVVGVAGAATRASIVQHQARGANMADVCAKDGSQETMVNLAAMITSLLVLPLLAPGSAVCWLLFAALVALHVWCNYRAVRSLQLTSLNRARLLLLVAKYLRHVDHSPSGTSCGQQLSASADESREQLSPSADESREQLAAPLLPQCSVEAINRQEAMMQSCGSAWRQIPGAADWRLHFGASVERAVLGTQLCAAVAADGAFTDRPYVVLAGNDGALHVLLEDVCSGQQQVEAVLAAAVFVSSCEQASDDHTWRRPTKQSLHTHVARMWPHFHSTLRQHGWHVDCPKLEPGSNRFRRHWKQE